MPEGTTSSPLVEPDVRISLLPPVTPFHLSVCERFLENRPSVGIADTVIGNYVRARAGD